MLLVELQCKDKKCGYSFTRLYKDKEEQKEIKEKCSKCGGEVKIVQEIDLKKEKSGCEGCSGCGGECKH